MLYPHIGRKTMKINQLWTALLVAMLLMPLLPARAAGPDELLLPGVVTAGEGLAIQAPVTGELAPFSLKEGDTVKAGDALFTLLPQEVYADVDGRVAAVYAGDGQSADGAVSRYGAVLQIEHSDRFELPCSALTGYNSAENRNLRVGMPVYLRSTNEERSADGLITLVNGQNFVVAVRGGDLEFGKDVKVYREPDYAERTLLARSRPSLLPCHSVPGRGMVVRMAVSPGDEVRQGHLLFTLRARDARAC